MTARIAAPKLVIAAALCLTVMAAGSWLLIQSGPGPQSTPSASVADSAGPSGSIAETPLYSDDQPAPGCADALQSMRPSSSHLDPNRSFQRDQALEDTLPETILGQATERQSAVGESSWTAFRHPFGILGLIAVICLDRPPSDLTMAFAGGLGFNYASLVEAIKVKGVTGAQLEQVVVVGARLDWQGPAEVRSVAGRTYRVLVEIALYSTADTLYALTASDKPLLSQPELDRYAFFDDVIRQLPAS